MMRTFKEILEGLKELVYPAECFICKRLIKEKKSIDNIICEECWQSLERNFPPFCPRCGRHTLQIDSRGCKNCIKYKFNFECAFSPLKYEEKIKELIWEFKYNQKIYLGNTLSKILIEFIKEFKIFKNIDCIIPIPLYKTRLREREFNQAEILAKSVADEFKKELLLKVLIRKISNRSQTELNEEERFLNVQNAFEVRDSIKIKDKNILLIDDVLTTGATVSSAALKLREAGCKKVFVLTLAS